MARPSLTVFPSLSGPYLVFCVGLAQWKGILGSENLKMKEDKKTQVFSLSVGTKIYSIPKHVTSWETGE